MDPIVANRDGLTGLYKATNPILWQFLFPSSSLRKFWVIIMGIAGLFSAIVIAFEVGLGQKSTAGESSLANFHVFIDILFAIDMVLSLVSWKITKVSPQALDEKFSSSSSSSASSPNYKAIPFGYIQSPTDASSSSWFRISGLVAGFDQCDSALRIPVLSINHLLTVIGTSPWSSFKWIIYHAFCILPFEVFLWSTIGTACSYMPPIKALYIQMLPRVLKTIRYSSWLDMTNILGLRRTWIGPPLNLFDLLMPLHFFACIWTWTTVVPWFGEHGDVDGGATFWATATGLPNWTGDNLGVVSDPTLPNYVDSATRYINALYFVAWMAMCVGMGDCKGITNAERLLSIIVMGYGAGLLAYAIGTQTSIIQYLTADSRSRVDAIHELQSWLLYRGVPSSLKKRSLLHTRAEQESSKARMSDVLDGVSLNLSTEMQTTILAGRINSTPITQLFANNKPLCSTLAAGMRSYKFARDEVICRQGGEITEIYFLVRGTVDLSVCAKSLNDFKTDMDIDASMASSKRLDTVPDWATQIWVGRVTEGCSIGLGPAILGGHHLVSARAAIETEILALPISLLNESLESHGLEGDENAMKMKAENDVSVLIGVLHSLAERIEGKSLSTSSTVAETDTLDNGPAEYSRTAVLTHAERITENSIASSKGKEVTAPNTLSSFFPGLLLIKGKSVTVHSDPRIEFVAEGVTKRVGDELAIRTLRYTQAPSSQFGAGIINYFGIPSLIKSNASPHTSPLADVTVQNTSSGKSLSRSPSMGDLLKEVAIRHGEYVWEDKESPLTLLKRGILFPDVLWKQCWDAWILLLVLYTSVSVPLILGFGVTSLDNNQHWANMEGIVDFFFFADMVFNFRQAYEDSKTGNFVTMPDAITYNYLSGFFITDFVSNIPIDAMVIATTGDAGGTRLFKLVRLVRLVRLLKLANSDFVSGLFLKYPRSANIASLLAQVLFACHLLSCFFVYCISSLDDLRAWWAVTVYVSADDSTMGLVPYMIPEPSLGELYLAAYYWSISTVTTTGIGDIGPSNNIQRAYNAFAILFGVVFFAYICGLLVGALTAQDGEGKAQSQLDLVEDASLAYRIPANTRGRLLRAHRWRLTHHSVFDEDSLLSNLPSMLSSDIRLLIDDRKVAALYVLRLSSWSALPSLLRTTYLPVNFILAVIAATERRFILAGDTVVRAGEKVKAVEFMYAGLAVFQGTEHIARSIDGDPTTPKGVGNSISPVITSTSTMASDSSDVSFSITNDTYKHSIPSLNTENTTRVPGGFPIGWNAVITPGVHRTTIIAHSDLVVFSIPVDTVSELLTSAGLRATIDGIEQIPRDA